MKLNTSNFQREVRAAYNRFSCCKFSVVCWGPRRAKPQQKDLCIQGSAPLLYASAPKVRPKGFSCPVPKGSSRSSLRPDSHRHLIIPTSVQLHPSQLRASELAFRESLQPEETSLGWQRPVSSLPQTRINPYFPFPPTVAFLAG